MTRLARPFSVLSTILGPAPEPTVTADDPWFSAWLQTPAGDDWITARAEYGRRCERAARLYHDVKAVQGEAAALEAVREAYGQEREGVTP